MFSRCFRHISGRICAIAALAAAGVLAGCEKRQTVQVPKEQASLLFEVMTGLDTEKYAETLPKVRRYQTIDETNPFIRELEAQTVTNLYFSRARMQLNNGDFKGAEKTMHEAGEKYDPRTERAEFEHFVSALNQADEAIRAFAEPMHAPDMRMNALKLKRAATGLPDSAFITAYANRKMNEADALEKLELDRRYVWLWFEAKDELSAGNRKMASLLAALISAGRPDGDADPMVRDLMNGGLFDKN